MFLIGDKIQCKQIHIKRWIVQIGNQSCLRFSCQFKVNAIVYFLLKVFAASAQVPGLSAVSMPCMVPGRGKFSYVPLPVFLTVEVPWCQISGWSQPLTVSEENNPAL